MLKKVCCALIIYLLFIFAFIPNSAALEESGAKHGFLLLGLNDLIGILFLGTTACPAPFKNFFLKNRGSAAPSLENLP
jgi:hypothetical protein